MSYPYPIHTVKIPVRLQVDTTIALFILTQVGSEYFTFNDNFDIEISKENPNSNEKVFWEEGILFLDMGNGVFDHHSANTKTTATELVLTFLKQTHNESLQKLFTLADRDDKYGKGTVSTDPIDRAFGFPGLLANLNKQYPENPKYIFTLLEYILLAHFKEEKKRFEELPLLIETLHKEGGIQEFKVKQRKNNLKVIYIETDELSLPGFLRAKVGGGYDVVVIKNPSSEHINILTRPTKRIDLRSLIAEIRKKELEKKEKFMSYTNDLSKYGEHNEINWWFYDTATNSIQNGGSNPDTTPATTLTTEEILEVVQTGLSEKNWSPLNKNNKEPEVSETLSDLLNKI